jgi:hypothetical protein
MKVQPIKCGDFHLHKKLDRLFNKADLVSVAVAYHYILNRRG